jgi:cysteinyl-tRNA synthetase
MALALYNSLTRSIEKFVPGDPAKVTFYSCGPTVYDDAHIGNFRSFLAADTLRRFIESPLCEVTTADGRAVGGPRKVLHVMNITDVGHMTDDDVADGGGEDKMAVAGRRIEEAKKAGKIPAGVSIDPRDPFAVAGFYADRFLEDARKLGLKVAIEQAGDASVMPRATTFVPAMVVVIQRLIDGGHAYVVGNAQSGRVVYFRVTSFPAYGQLSGNSVDRLREGEGGRISAENQAGKEHPADFMLWKEDPKHIMKWPSPWGWGYPGWHIECTAMSVWRAAMARADASEAAFDALAQWSQAGSTALIDLHSGGEDNVFPHHECEMAQSCCAFNSEPERAPFARMWFHARHLFVEGQKMSKSKGNFYTARDLFARGHEPAALRLELIRVHYRTNANFTMQGLEDCGRMVARWRTIAAGTGAGDAGAEARAEAFLAEFAGAMHDDLNVARAIASVNGWMNTISTPGAADARAMSIIDGVLGVLSLPRLASTATSIAVYLPGVTPDASIEALLAQRRDARAAKDFKASDAIRDQLAALGLAIKDAPGGRVEVSRK